MPRQNNKMPRASTAPPKTPISTGDEKVVRQTGRTVPVEPAKPSGKATEPMPEPAVDHRKQIVGTDELRRGTERNRANR